jgi:transposase
VLAHGTTSCMNVAASSSGISYRTIRRSRRRHRDGGTLGLAPRYRPERRRRITPEVRELIRLARTDHRFGRARTMVWLQRVYGIRVGVSSIQRVFRQLRLRRLRCTPNRRPRQLKPFSTDMPGETVQADVPCMRINCQRVFQYTALDDRTRFRVLRLYRYLNAHEPRVPGEDPAGLAVSDSASLIRRRHGVAVGIPAIRRSARDSTPVRQAASVTAARKGRTKSSHRSRRILRPASVRFVRRGRRRVPALGSVRQRRTLFVSARRPHPGRDAGGSASVDVPSTRVTGEASGHGPLTSERGRVPLAGMEGSRSRGTGGQP